MGIADRICTEPLAEMLNAVSFCIAETNQVNRIAIPLIILLFALTGFGQTSKVEVESGSMEPNIQIGDLLIVGPRVFCLQAHSTLRYCRV